MRTWTSFLQVTDPREYYSNIPCFYFYSLAVDNLDPSGIRRGRFDVGIYIHVLLSSFPISIVIGKPSQYLISACNVAASLKSRRLLTTCFSFDRTVRME